MSGEKAINVNINSKMICNSAEMAMAIAGMGITRLPLFSCQSALERGELKRILTTYERTGLNVYVVYPHGQFVPAKLRVFIDAIAAYYNRATLA